MAIQKVELSSALNSLATQSSIDKVTGMLGGAAANISKADLAKVVAGVILFRKIYRKCKCNWRCKYSS